MYAIHWAKGGITEVPTFQNVFQMAEVWFPGKKVDYEENDKIHKGERRSWSFFFEDDEDGENNFEVVALGKTDDYDYPVINL